MENMVKASAVPDAKTLSAYRGKRIFVTGDTGFKGSWLSLWLSELGADVTGYALPPSYPHSHFELLGLNRTIRHIDGDIRDAASLAKHLRDARPEFVFHLAAQSLVRRSYADPLETFSTNVLGSAHLLEAVRNAPSVRALIYVTSDKCYLNKEWEWSYRETDELGGHDPYSASKAAAEKVFQGYYHSFLKHRPELGAATVRAGNVIGGGDWAADRLIPDCIRALQNGKPIVLRNPDATRPWQFVLEPVGGYLVHALRLAQAPQRYAGSWNYGPEAGSLQTVAEVVGRIIELWGTGKIERETANDTRHEAMLLQLSIDKVRGQLGWRPIYDAAKSIDQTVRWYRTMHRGNASAADLSRTQIREYMAAADEVRAGH